MNELKFKFWLCRIETESTECEIEQNDTDLKEIEDEKQSVLPKSGKTWEAKNHVQNPFQEKNTRVLGLNCFRIATKTKTQKKKQFRRPKTQLLEDLVFFYQPQTRTSAVK